MTPQQSAQVDGRNNVVIQVVGDGVSVIVGQPALRLLPLSRLEGRKTTSDLDLLKAHFQKTRFVGRDSDLDALWTWTMSDRPISVRALIGSAGSGKTRLAIELLKRLREEAKDWQGGFLPSDELMDYARQQSLADLAWRKPTLIVVDYAASLLEGLRKALRNLASAEAPKYPLRLLLLERFAERDRGWFSDLVQMSLTGGVEELFHQPEPVAIAPVIEHADRREILRDAVAAFAEFHETVPVPIPSIPDRGKQPEFDRLLEQSQSANPLVPMMAAFAAFDSGWIGALSLSAAQLATQLAERESTRNQKFARDNDPARRLLVHMAAYATLTGGLSLKAAVEASERESAALKLEYPGGAGQLATHLATALPDPKGVAAMAPDIIGEAFVLRELAKRDQSGAETVLRAAQQEPVAVSSFLVRTFQDNFQDSDQKPLRQALDWLDALAGAGQSGEVQLLMGIEAALPVSTVGMRELAAEVTHTLLRLLETTKSDEDHLTAEKARLSNNLANRLSALGRREEALEQAQEAVRLRRQLAAARPDAFLPDLAMSLAMLGSCQTGLGAYLEAASSFHEGLSLLTPMFERLPRAFANLVATMTNDYAEAAQQAGALRDEQLLQRIRTVFEKLKEERHHDSGH
jgi:tetratricopeptide (TPR) repeat protein